MYKVRLYKQSNNDSPITDFINKLNTSAKKKIFHQIKYLELFGLSKENSHLKKLTNTPLWEIRILGNDSIRIICSTFIKNEILIVHIFKKKSNKIKQNDINISLFRYKDELDKTTSF